MDLVQHCPYAAPAPPTPADEDEDGSLLPHTRFSMRCCIVLLVQIDTRPDGKHELRPTTLSTVLAVVLTSTTAAALGRGEKDVEAGEGPEDEYGANLKAACARRS
jgi:hypothetical protein